MDKNIMVSIWCITYNHAPYIRDAIEGFINQHTNFEYEIIIHDDASTDNTASIIREYEIKYPTMIHGIYQAENQYKKNLPSIEWAQKIQRKNCRGKYIAFCEGDDYWIDSNKLQMQIDYMEKHSECIMTLHNAVVIDYESSEVKAKNPFRKEEDLTAEQVILQIYGHMPTASIVYRKEIAEIDGFFLQTGIADYPIELYCLSKGIVHYFDRIMSVYRFRHKGSYDEGLYQDKKKYFIHCIGLVSFLEQYNRYTGKIYEKYVIERLQGFVDGIINSYSGRPQEEFINVCKECDKETKYKFHIYIDEIIRIYSLLYENDFIGEELQNYCKENQKIFIMGAGKYAGIIARKFERYNIQYQGFIVSNGQECERTYRGKDIHVFNELIPELNNAAIVIGINPCIWSQIAEQLEEENIKNYYCPFRICIGN